MTKEEILEELIGLDPRNKDPHESAARLCRVYGSFNAVVESQRSDIVDIAGVSEATAQLITMIPDYARYIYREKIKDVTDLSSCKRASEYLRMFYLGQHNEMMYVLAVDDQGKLLKCDLVQEGTVDETGFYVRKVMECAILSDASAIIISHNHPGGTLMVSMADSSCTKLVSHVCSDYGILVLDHIIIADAAAHSMAKAGEMPQQQFKPQGNALKLKQGWLLDDGQERDDGKGTNDE